jgi:hypothetical protein
LLSPRTADYVATPMREGDNFDYCKWLERIRREEADTGKSQAAFNWSDVITSEGEGNSISTPGCEDARLSLKQASTIQPRPVAKTIIRSLRQESVNPEIRIRQRLEKVHDALDKFQASRARDAVYDYLEAVFAIVEHYRVLRRTKRLLRRAFEFANLPFDKNADPFSGIIRCTCGDAADSKTISKWARALRYVARSKGPGKPVRAFMKEAGGVNACADRYARRMGR